MAVNMYMKRKGDRAATAMIMRNKYSSQFGIQYYLIVEGESDEHFFENILDYHNCKVINLDGKPKVKEFIKARNIRGEKGYLGIVDADFEHITKYEPKVDNVLLTDYHDIEMMMISSNPNMRRIYSELSENILIENFEKSSKKVFLDAVLNASYEIGLYKIIMQRPKYNIDSDVPYELVNESFEVNMDELIKRTIKRHHSLYDVKKEIDAERKKNHDKYQVCCGHVVAEILCHSFIAQEEGGLGYGKNDSRLNKNRVEELLRAIYDLNHFQSTKLYAEILEWEKKNKICILDKSIYTVA